jgi:hypothetical protein
VVQSGPIPESENWSVHAESLSRSSDCTARRLLPMPFSSLLESLIFDEVERRQPTHDQLAQRSELPHSPVTGILSGRLQKVTGVIRTPAPLVRS